MLARPLLREHFQILGSVFFFFFFFLPRTNTANLLDWYCGIIKETGLFFAWASKLPRKCESKHCLPFGADGLSFVRSACGQVIVTFSEMGRFTYPWCSAGACVSSAISN